MYISKYASPSIKTVNNNNNNSVVLVRTWIILTKRLPLVGKVSDNFCGQRVSHGQHGRSLQLYSIYISSKQLLSCTHEAEWTQFQTHYFSENLVVPGIEPRPWTVLFISDIQVFIHPRWPPLWSSGQSSWLQIQGSQVRFPGTTKKKSSGSGTGSTQPCEYNWGATW
jgi:hypothetical protein